jgi:predicted Zn finger-like uncharacterized protein
MDVQCERCKTEYEFDDALVSGRGTTVRCTTCGHQFKVRRAEGTDGTGDRWLVKTAGGQQFTFLTLRELQRAILAQQVSRNDLLRRAGAPPRPLGSISELEPFFEGRPTSNRPPPGDGATPVGGIGLPVAFPKRSSVTWEEDPQEDPPTVPLRSTHLYGEAPPPMRRKIDTLRPPLGTGAAPPPPITPQPIVSSTPYPAVATQVGGYGNVRTAPLRQQAPPAAPPYQPPYQPPYPGSQQVTPSPPPSPFAEPSLPPPTRPVRRSSASGDYDQLEMGPSIPPSLEEPYSVRRGRRVGGWIVALVLLLAAGVLGWAVAKPYLTARAATAAVQLDPRAESFIAGGEKAMGDGNLDEAQEDLDKASALAENDPRVRLDEARIATAQADVPWLKLKLLPPAAVDEVRTTKSQVDDRVARAGRLADAALLGSPDSPAAARVKIDALRLAGQQDAARALVAKVIAEASQPETAYVLAALDLAEPEPLWTTVLDRLRLAAGGEGNAGRARAALVYALARSGDVSGARAELAKLDALARPYPLSPNLHALVEKTPSKTVDGGVDTAASPRAPVNAPPAPMAAAPAQVGAAPANVPAPAQAPAGESVPPDSRGAMALASAAYKKGDFSRAEQIYEAIVTRNPGDSEALASLGDVARAQGDLPTAIANYKRAIAVNPSYLPALMGLADTQWASGDRTAAGKAYGDIVDRFPEGTYPGYVKQRVDSPVDPARAAQPAPAEPKAAPSPPAPEESSP